MARKAFISGTVALLGVGLISSIFLLTVHAHGERTGCPFMPHENAPCMMDVNDHIAAYQRMTTTTVSELGILLLGLLALFVLAFSEGATIQEYVVRITRVRDPVPRSPLQLLLARGIMHPKNP